MRFRKLGPYRMYPGDLLSEGGKDRKTWNHRNLVSSEEATLIQNTEPIAFDFKSDTHLPLSASSIPSNDYLPDSYILTVNLA